MTSSSPARCSDVANALDEPMAGTADHRERWLLVEDGSAWDEHAVRDVLGAELEGDAKARRMRLLLVRRRAPDAVPNGGLRRAWLVEPATRRIARRDLADVAELAGLLDATLDEFGAPSDEPMLLVCTNGRRDACCALRGRALMAALAVDHADWTWECTHIGGHRFAGNLVCLPDGLVYGRVAPADGPRLADAYRRGEVDATLLRGRSSWPAPAQVAEVELRIRLGQHALDAIRLRSVEETGGTATVELDTNGLTHRCELVAERAEPARATSCRGDKLEAPIHWRLVGLVEAMPVT